MRSIYALRGKPFRMRSQVQLVREDCDLDSKGQSAEWDAETGGGQSATQPAGMKLSASSHGQPLYSHWT